MSDPFVTVRLPGFLTHFSERMKGLPEQVVNASAPVLRKEEEASIKARWYRRGRTLQSLQEEVKVEPNKAIYRLFPTVFYAVFGEFGTGRRGAQTGRPAPRGWKYGPKPGMTARRFSRIAVQNARPKVIKVAQQEVRQFARNVTVK